METIKKQKLVWDVSDLDPVTEFPKDCRRFNGGYICLEKPSKTPTKSPDDKLPINNVKTFDRLRP